MGLIGREIHTGDINETRTPFPAGKYTPQEKHQMEQAARLANESRFQEAVIEAYKKVQDGNMDEGVEALQRKDTVAQEIFGSSEPIDSAITTAASKAILKLYAAQHPDQSK